MTREEKRKNVQKLQSFIQGLEDLTNQLRNKLNKQVAELDELLLDEELAKSCYYKLVSQSGYGSNKQEFHYMKLVKKKNIL